MSRYLLVSDFHNDLAAWAWLKTSCRKFDAVFYAGDFFSANIFSLPINKLIAIRSKYLAEFPVPFFCCTGNHDWDELLTDAGQGYWLRNLAEQYPNIKTAGVHPLPGDGWTLQIVDWMEEPITTGEFGGPQTMLLQHVAPSGPCSIQHGCDYGDEQLARDIQYSGPAIICSGHTHQPERHIHRQGASLVLNPGVGDQVGKPNYIMIDTSAGTCVWHGGKRGEIAKI